MRDIAIYGAGGFGRETALLIRQINGNSRKWNITGFYDDGKNLGSTIDGFPVLGGMEELRRENPTDVVIAIADPVIRHTIYHALSGNDFTFPTLVHPTVQPGDPLNQIGRGAILGAGVILTTHVSIGDFVIINLSCTIGHDVEVGAFSTIMPGCHISGNVVIGEQAMLGTGSILLSNISIANKVRVGAGAVVTRSHVDEGETLIGIPAYPK